MILNDLQRDGVNSDAFKALSENECSVDDLQKDLISIDVVVTRSFLLFLRMIQYFIYSNTLYLYLFRHSITNTKVRSSLCWGGSFIALIEEELEKRSLYYLTLRRESLTDEVGKWTFFLSYELRGKMDLLSFIFSKILGKFPFSSLSEN